VHHSHLGAASKFWFRCLKRGRSSSFVAAAYRFLNRLYKRTDAGTPRAVDTAAADITSNPFDG